jgi:hypothetical protein
MLEGIGIAEYLAFTHKRHDAERLREALEFTISLKRLAGSCENLKRVAAELDETGLIDMAELVNAAAEKAPHEWDCKPHWPHDCASLIGRWHADMAKRKEIWESAQAVRS